MQPSWTFAKVHAWIRKALSCPSRKKQILLMTSQSRAGWEAACTPTSILEDFGGELTCLAPISQRKMAKGWGRFINHLRFNEPAALLEPIAARITLGRVRGYAPKTGVGLCRT